MGRIPKHATARDRMERKPLTRLGQALDRLRSYAIEPVFGQMSMRGLTRFWLRGLQQGQGEWSLWYSTHITCSRSGARGSCLRGFGHWQADKGDPQTALAVGVRSTPTL